MFTHNKRFTAYLSLFLYSCPPNHNSAEASNSVLNYQKSPNPQMNDGNKSTLQTVIKGRLLVCGWSGFVVFSFFFFKIWHDLILTRTCFHILGGGNSNIFLFFFTPKIGEDEPILTSIFFEEVGWNHQLAFGKVRARQVGNKKLPSEGSWGSQDAGKGSIKDLLVLLTKGRAHINK